MSAGWLLIFGVLGGGAVVSGIVGALIPGLWGFAVAIPIYSVMILAVIVVLTGSGEQ